MAAKRRGCFPLARLRSGRAFDKLPRLMEDGATLCCAIPIVGARIDLFLGV
jgi:hypothetical protein